jgi:hypothetical protein
MHSLQVLHPVSCSFLSTVVLNNKCVHSLFTVFVRRSNQSIGHNFYWVRTILLSAGCRAKTSSKLLFLSPGWDATTDGWPWFLSYRPRLSAACGFSNFFFSSCHMPVGIFIVYRRYMMPQMEWWNLWLDYSWQYYPSHIVYLIRSSLTKTMVWTIWMMHRGAKCLSNILKKLAVWSTNVISFYQL